MKYKKIAILGLGKSGVSCYKYFSSSKGYESLGNKKYLDIVAWDDVEEKREVYKKQGFNIVNPALWSYEELDIIISSPGLPLHYPKEHIVYTKAKENNISISCDIDIFLQLYKDKKIIAITGTNGKSTVASLLAHIYSKLGEKVCLAGNIGIPVFDIDPKDVTYIILELSSFQLSLMENHHINCAILTNIEPDHINVHGSFEHYYKSKIKIFNNQLSTDVAIASHQALPYCKTTINQQKLLIISNNSSGNITTVNNVLFNKDNNTRILDFNDMAYLKGEHNQQNIALTYACANFFGLNNDKIVNAIKSFTGLKHRQKFITNINNVNFIDDSKSTNPESTYQALKTFSNNIYLIMGGITKRNDIDILLPIFNNVKKVYLIGKNKSLFTNIFIKHNINFIQSVSLAEATQNAYNDAMEVKEATVLLSPACASYDEFKNFEHRGEVFIEAVYNIKRDIEES